MVRSFAAVELGVIGCTATVTENWRDCVHCSNHISTSSVRRHNIIFQHGTPVVANTRLSLCSLVVDKYLCLIESTAGSTDLLKFVCIIFL